jgi:hypothetical protein
VDARTITCLDLLICTSSKRAISELTGQKLTPLK